MAVTNKNLINGEIKRRFNSGNACYHSVPNLLSSRLLSKNVKIRIYKTTILLVILYGCETWSLTLRDEHTSRVWNKNNVHKLFVGRPEGKRPLGRPRRRFLDNIKMDLGEVGWDDMDRIGLVQDTNR
jgi:hypothetical protein